MERNRLPQRAWSAALTHTITKPVIAVVMGVCGSLIAVFLADFGLRCCVARKKTSASTG